MRRLPTLIVLALVAACAPDSGAPLAPERAADAKPALTTSSSGGYIRVRTQSIGADGSIFRFSDPLEVCAQEYFPITWHGGTSTVTWYTWCRPGLLSGGDAAPYNGGTVNVFVLGDSGYEYLESIPGDYTEAEVVDIPVGSTVKLQSFTNAGCVFNGYRTASGLVKTNPLVVSSGIIKAEFVCS